MTTYTDNDKPCVICGKSLAKNARDPRWLKGNNAEPVKTGQCCDICDDEVVIPTRIHLATGMALKTAKQIIASSAAHRRQQNGT